MSPRPRNGFVRCADCGTLTAQGSTCIDCTTQTVVTVLAARKPRKKCRNAWREMVVEAHHLALLTWEQERDQVCIGYDWEETEYVLAHPRPTLKYMMKQLAYRNEDAA